MSGAGFFMGYRCQLPKVGDEEVVAGQIPITKAAAKNTALPAHPLEDSVTLVERVALAINRELAEIEAIVGTMPGKSRPNEAAPSAYIEAFSAEAAADRGGGRPAGVFRQRADACGIVAAGICAAGVVYVLADDTVSAVTPSAWANIVIALW